MSVREVRNGPVMMIGVCAVLALGSLLAACEAPASRSESGDGNADGNGAESGHGAVYSPITYIRPDDRVALDDDTATFRDALLGGQLSIAKDLWSANLVDRRPRVLRQIWQNLLEGGFVSPERGAAMQLFLTLARDPAILDHHISVTGLTAVSALCKSETLPQTLFDDAPRGNRTYVRDYEDCFGILQSITASRGRIMYDAMPPERLRAILERLIAVSDGFAVNGTRNDDVSAPGNMISSALTAALAAPLVDPLADPLAGAPTDRGGGLALDMLALMLRTYGVSEDTPTEAFVFLRNVGGTPARLLEDGVLDAYRADTPLIVQLYEHAATLDTHDAGLIRMYGLLADDFGFDLAVRDQAGRTLRRRAVEDGRDMVAHFLAGRGVPR